MEQGIIFQTISHDKLWMKKNRKVRMYGCYNRIILLYGRINIVKNQLYFNKIIAFFKELGFRVQNHLGSA